MASEDDHEVTLVEQQLEGHDEQEAILVEKEESKEDINNENNEVAQQPLPSIEKAFLMYAVLPLFLLLLPGLMEQMINMDYSSSVAASLLFFGFGATNASMRTDGTTPGSTITVDAPAHEQIITARPASSDRQNVNIDRELQYLQNMRENERRRNEQQRRIKQNPNSARETATDSNSGGRLVGVKSAREKVDDIIAAARHVSENDRTDPFKALDLADLLRNRDLTYHDGGSVREEAVETYQRTIRLLLSRRELLIKQGMATNQISDAHALQWMKSNPEYAGDEFYILDYRRKSVDGLLCVAFTSLGKVYYMASMFEDSADAMNQALKYKPFDMDAMNQRANTYIILGKYKEAADDYVYILAIDKKRIFADAFTGMAKVLTVKEEVVPDGWDSLISILNDHIPYIYEKWQQSSNNPELLSRHADQLKRMHLVMFQYYDVKVNDLDLAWMHLRKGQQFKMSTIEPFNSRAEDHRIQTIMDIFQPSIWMPGIGSDSIAPIFIVGFVRSGSTLLERILDSHHLVAGTGEDSIFNGQLERIRSAIVAASASGPEELQKAVLAQADGVLKGMRERWAVTNTSSNNKNVSDVIPPHRFVDKMLTNYLNVGFIHMVFPKALILHVARNPMDTIFSAYKHDFAPGHLDYLSEFESLTQIYDNYRKVMNHWDKVLPGRVTHVRYEDIVNDLPGMAKAIVAAADLPWDPDVLNFHKKKHAVNTLSTTQVRKAIYKDAMNSWMRYEKHLAPLVKLVKKNVEYSLKTSLPGYEPQESN